MIGAAAAAAAAFNLVCTGTVVSELGSAREESAWEETFRVDLRTEEFCSDECPVPLPLAHHTPLWLIFFDDRTQTTNGSVEYVQRVDRRDGAFYGYYSKVDRELDGGIYVSKTEGACVRAPFSGFPVVETRF